MRRIHEYGIRDAAWKIGGHLLLVRIRSVGSWSGAGFVVLIGKFAETALECEIFGEHDNCSRNRFEEDTVMLSLRPTSQNFSDEAQGHRLMCSRSAMYL